MVLAKMLACIEIINGIVEFGSQSYNNSQLRKILNITNSTTHAHHIIPFDFRNSSLIQKAAKSDNVFHISEKLNGIPLPSTNHLTGHQAYNTKIGEVLTRINNQVGNNNELAYSELKRFINHLDGLIRNNPNKNLGEIATLIIF